MVIFVGSKNAGYFASEVCKKRKFNLIYIDENINIKEQSNDILFEGADAKFIIYDIDQYHNEASEIVEEIINIKRALNIKPIILTPSFRAESSIIRLLLDNDIKNFVVSANTLSEQKDELEKSLNGYYDNNKRDELIYIEEVIKEEESRLENLTTIAVAGTSHKVGVSSQCFQIVKYLNYLGYRACYFELNHNLYENRNKSIIKEDEISFAEKIKSLFDIQKVDDELGYFICEGIDIYYDASKLSDVLKMGYEYIVYDYGVYKDRSFNKTAFLKDDINIFIASAFVTEIDNAIDLALNTSYKNSKIIFSFCSNDEKENIKDLFSSIILAKDKSNVNRCFFAKYSPSLFKLGQKELYDEIFNLENKNEDINEEKEKKRFSFKRKKGKMKQ